MAESDGCPYCEETETMEHLYYACEKYSELQWIEIAARISEMASAIRGERTAVRITFENIIFNREIENLKNYIKDIKIRKFIQILVHEIRRDIQYITGK